MMADLVVVGEIVASRINGMWFRRNLFTSVEWREHFNVADVDQARRLAAEAVEALREHAMYRRGS